MGNWGSKKGPAQSHPGCWRWGQGDSSWHSLGSPQGCERQGCLMLQRPVRPWLPWQWDPATMFPHLPNTDAKKPASLKWLFFPLVWFLPGQELISFKKKKKIPSPSQTLKEEEYDLSWLRSVVCVCFLKEMIKNYNKVSVQLTPSSQA